MECWIIADGLMSPIKLDTCIHMLCGITLDYKTCVYVY